MKPENACVGHARQRRLVPGQSQAGLVMPLEQQSGLPAGP